MIKKSVDQNIKTELLYLYVKNHTGHIIYYALIALFFLVAYAGLLGLPDNKLTMLTGYALLAISGVFLIRQINLYKKILKTQKSKIQDRYILTLWKIALNKLGYIIPWMLILFWPYNSSLSEGHYLGYIFILCSIVLYSSKSAPCLFLLLWDVGAYLFITALIIVYNHGAYEISYELGIGLFVSFFALHTGSKMHKLAKELVESRIYSENIARREQEANKVKTDFLAVMSHEIRTPLSGVLGMVDLLDDTTLTRKQRGIIETIRSCSNTLLNTLNDILDISKIESGKFEIERISIDLHELLEKTVKIMEAKASEKGLDVNLLVSDKCPGQIVGDPNRTRQVLVNLMSNAIKFTEKGSISVEASPHPEKTAIIIKVTDTGSGMTEKEQRKLFQKFSQADSSISRKHGGTGLGLSITKNLVELMGGSIHVDSKKGEGSCFWFELPYKELSMPALISGKTDVPAYVMGLNILLVEDNETNQIIAQRLLAKHEHNVTTASSGEEALDTLLKNSNFDLILMDMQMPGMDGIVTTKNIRLHGKPYTEIPIISLTANILEDHLDKCLKAGMVDRITKPITPSELYEKIWQHTPENKKTRIIRTAQKTVENSTERLEEIEETMGEEYLDSFVKRTVSDMNGLLEEINSAYEKKDFQAISNAAHDLKSITGTLGLNELYNLSEDAEELSEDIPEDKAKNIIKRMNKLIFKETDRLYSDKKKQAASE